MFDPFEVPAMALADFGITATVTPIDGSSGYDIQVLPSSPMEELKIGNDMAMVGKFNFRALPDAAANIQEGDIITLSTGETFAVYDIAPNPFQMTQILAQEQ